MTVNQTEPAPLAPLQAALKRLGEHCSGCPTCMTRDEATGRNANLPCATADELYERWRQAYRGAGSSPTTRRVP